MPKGYVILLLDVHDPEGYGEYLDKAATTVTAYGGEFLFASDDPHVVEGAWTAQRTIVIKFPSVAAASSWYESQDYHPLIADRQATADSRVAIFEGDETLE